MPAPHNSIIDWNKAVLILRVATRQPDYKIAAMCGVRQSTIKDIAIGRRKDVQFNVGVRIIDAVYDAAPDQIQSIYRG